MIIKLKRNGEIKVLKNSTENTNNLNVKVINEEITTGRDIYYVAINKVQLEKYGSFYKLDTKTLKREENLLEVIWKKPNEETKKFTLVTEIQQYISLGGLKPEERPQVILDLYDKIEYLEKRIKKLEEKGTVI